MSKDIVYVVCFNCHKRIPQNEAIYIQWYDTYLCEGCYTGMVDGKPIQLSNYHKGGA